MVLERSLLLPIAALATLGLSPRRSHAADAAGPLAPGEAELNQCLKVPPGKKIRVTLRPEADLDDLVQFVESFTCRRFVYGSTLRSGKVTVVLPEEVSAAEAYRAFLLGLEQMRLTVIPSGSLLAIVDARDAHEEAPPFFTADGPSPPTEQVVTRLFHLEHAHVEEVASVLATVKSASGQIVPYAPTGAILVTDVDASVAAMSRLIRALDVPAPGSDLFVIQLRNAPADRVKAKLDEIFTRPGRSAASGDGHGSPAPAAGAAGDLHVDALVADERTGTLFVLGDERAYLAVLAVARRLDVSLAGTDDLVHVYPLENADATAVAQALASITGGAAPSSGTPGGTPVAFEGPVRVTAEKDSNSLLIVASAKDYLALGDVLRRLDEPRRQVVVEAEIAEISLDHLRDVGVSLHGADDTHAFGDTTTAVGASSLTQLSTLDLADSLKGGVPTGLTLGLFGPTATKLLGLSIPSVGLLLEALQTSGDVNVLSSPSLLTTDNKPSEISVGQDVPYPGSVVPTGFFGQTSASQPTSFGFTTSVQRLKVALKMDITPHVSVGSSVRLDVDVEIADVFDKNYGGLGPATNNRLAKGTIVLRDQQTAVLGGLYSDKLAVSDSKVPLLGDLPIVGVLFRRRSTELVKTDLVIFLTPYVIHDAADLERIFEDKREERRRFLEAYGTLHDDHDPALPIDYSGKPGLVDAIDLDAVTLDERRRAMDAARDRGVAEGEGTVVPASEPVAAPATQP